MMISSPTFMNNYAKGNFSNKMCIYSDLSIIKYNRIELFISIVNF